MSNLPTVKSKEFIKVIKKIGFVLHRQQGSHAIYKNIHGLRVVVPIHAGKDLKTKYINEYDSGYWSRQRKVL